MRTKGSKKRDTKGKTDKGTGEDVLNFVDLMRSQSSVEIKKDAKGALVFTVKAYADTVDDAVDEAVAAFGRLTDELK